MYLFWNISCFEIFTFNSTITRRIPWMCQQIGEERKWDQNYTCESTSERAKNSVIPRRLPTYDDETEFNEERAYLHWKISLSTTICTKVTFFKFAVILIFNLSSLQSIEMTWLKTLKCLQYGGMVVEPKKNTAAYGAPLNLGACSGYFVLPFTNDMWMPAVSTFNIPQSEVTDIVS